MAYLEGRIKEIESKSVPPSKEGGLAALSSKKLWAGYGIPIYTIPIFHHSFRLWSKALQDHSYNMANKVFEACQTNCTSSVKLLRGTHSPTNEDDIKKCSKDCSQKLAGNYFYDLEEAKRESEQIFNECLTKRVLSQIQYEDVLNCKSTAFNFLLEENLKAEEKFLIKTLNKFG